MPFPNTKDHRPLCLSTWQFAGYSQQLTPRIYRLSSSLVVLTLVATISFFAGQTRDLSAQTLQPESSDEKKELYQTVTQTRVHHQAGQIAYSVFESRAWIFEKREYEFLHNLQVLDELNVNDDMKRKIEKFLEQLSEARKHIDEISAAKAAKATLIQEVQEDSRRFETEFRAIFNADERRALQAIAARSRLVNQGLARYLTERELTHPRLESALKSIRFEFEQLAGQETKQTTEDVLKLLNDAQKLQLSELCLKDVDPNTPIEIQIWQLGHAIDSSSSPTHGLVDELARGDLFSLDLDGFLVETRGTETGDIVQAVLFQADQGKLAFELIPEQHLAFSEKAAELTRSFATDIGVLHKQWQAGEISGFEWLRQFEARRLEWHQNRWKEFNETLIPAQRKQVEEWCLGVVIAQRGLVAALVDGLVHDRLKLTTDQQMRLLELARSRLQQLQNVRKDMSSSLWRDLQEQTSVEFTANIRESLNFDTRQLSGLRSPQLIVRE